MQRKKKFCACIFAVLLAQAACLPVAFADDGKHWADETFASLLESRTVLPGEFGRADYDISITRGRFTEVFVRLLEADGPTGGGAHFTDVEEGSEHYLSSAKAKIAGLVSGHADGTFRPDAEMQRQEMFAVVGRLFAAAGADLPGGEGIRFTDGPAIAPYAADAVRRLAAAGIIKGYEDGTVKPGAPVSCAEAMAVVLRVKAALDEAAADAGVT
ncbi:MAG: S-layer homology domain-containing protein, partial [Clostridiales Family XIII bacterium]|nr:S-layer homology domain-containing protein [Clostridiales Family XIII bacterium]